MPRKRDTGVGAAIARLRRAGGLTQQALADAAGVSQPYIAHIENGRHEPSPAVLGDIAKALGVTVDALLKEGE